MFFLSTVLSVIIYSFFPLSNDAAVPSLFYTVAPPPDVDSVEVVTQNESSITLQWDQVNNITTYSLQYEFNQTNEVENISDYSGTYVVSGLKSGKQYNFTLYTVLNEDRSTGYSFLAVTGR